MCGTPQGDEAETVSEARDRYTACARHPSRRGELRPPLRPVRVQIAAARAARLAHVIQCIEEVIPAQGRPKPRPCQPQVQHSVQVAMHKRRHRTQRRAAGSARTRSGEGHQRTKLRTVTRLRRILRVRLHRIEDLGLTALQHRLENGAWSMDGRTTPCERERGGGAFVCVQGHCIGTLDAPRALGFVVSLAESHV